MLGRITELFDALCLDVTCPVIVESGFEPVQFQPAIVGDAARADVGLDPPHGAFRHLNGFPLVAAVVHYFGQHRLTTEGKNARRRPDFDRASQFLLRPAHPTPLL